MGIVVAFPHHARTSADSERAGSRIRLAAEIPVSRSIRSASPQDTPRLPASTSDRCGSEQPTASANAFWVPSNAATCSVRRASPSMTKSLPQVNGSRQAKVYCEKIDNGALLVNDLVMGRENSLKEPKLFIGEWIEALELKQSKVAKDSGVKKSYLNLLCHRKRDNPSLDVLQAIAEA